MNETRGRMRKILLNETKRKKVAALFYKTESAAGSLFDLQALSLPTIQAFVPVPLLYPFII